MTAAIIVVVAIAFLLLLFLFAAIKVAREYERGIIFRLGRLLPEPKGPGLFILIPIVDRMVKVDLRTITLNIPPQEVITKDNVPVRVNAVAYFRIVEPEERNRPGRELHGRDLADRADDAPRGPRPARPGRAAVGAREDQLDPPGDHRRPDRSVGDQGLDRGGQGRRDPERHAARDGATGRGRARAAGEGDQRRGRVPGVRTPEGRGARDRGHPIALQLRYLQTLLEIGASNATTIVFPAPIELIKPFLAGPQQRREVTLRRDPISGRLVAIAPGRAGRPGAGNALIEPATQEELDECPFCAGREDRTPPGDVPAAGRRRVDRPRCPEPLSGARAAGGGHPFAGAQALLREPVGRGDRVRGSSVARRGIAAVDAGFPYPFPLINEGHTAGSSLPHSHSQIAFLREAPPAARAAGRSGRFRGDRAAPTSWSSPRTS